MMYDHRILVPVLLLACLGLYVHAVGMVSAEATAPLVKVTKSYAVSATPAVLTARDALVTPSQVTAIYRYCMKPVPPQCDIDINQNNWVNTLYLPIFFHVGLDISPVLGFGGGAPIGYGGGFIGGGIFGGGYPGGGIGNIGDYANSSNGNGCGGNWSRQPCNRGGRTPLPSFWRNTDGYNLFSPFRIPGGYRAYSPYGFGYGFGPFTPSRQLLPPSDLVVVPRR